MADLSQWKTKTIVLKGGTRLDIVPVYRDATLPGSLIDSKNFQTGVQGGYQRIKGYTKYDATAVTGSGRILGAFVFNNGVIACRGENIYFGTGSGWGAAINSVAQTSAGQYRATKYTWSESRIAMTDEVNYPVRYNGTALTRLTNAPQGATCVWEYKNYLFFGKGGTLTQSVAGDDTTYSGGSSATYTVGDTITGLRTWRDSLYIFCRSSIYKLTGSSNADFAIEPVTKNLGCMFPDTIQEVSGDIVFLGPDGLRTISATDKVLGDGHGEVNIDTFSLPLKDYMGTNYALYGVSAANARISALCIPSLSQYRLFYAKDTVAAASAVGLNACLQKTQEGANAFELFKLMGMQVSCGDNGLVASGLTELVIHGDYDGYIYTQNFGDNFNSSNIPAFIQLPFLVFDDPALRKTIYKLRLYVTVTDNAIANLTAQLTLDDNDSTVIQPSSVSLTNNFPATTAIYGFSGSLYGQAVYGQGAPSAYITPVVGAGYNASITISSDDTRPQYTVKTLIFEYSLDARQ